MSTTDTRAAAEATLTKPAATLLLRLPSPVRAALAAGC